MDQSYKKTLLLLGLKINIQVKRLRPKCPKFKDRVVRES